MGRRSKADSVQYNALNHSKVFSYEKFRDEYLGDEVNKARALGITLDIISEFTGVSRHKFGQLSKEQGYKPNKYHTPEELRAMYLEKSLWCTCLKNPEIHELFENTGIPITVRSRDLEFQERVRTRLEMKGHA